MAFGFNIKTPRGTISTDDINGSLRFLSSVAFSGASGTVTCPTVWTTSNGDLFYRITSGGIYDKYDVSWTSTTFTYSGGYSNQTGRVWFFLTKETAASTSGYGFWIKNSAGKIIADSAYKPVSIESSGTSTSSNSGSQYGTTMYRHVISCGTTDLVFLPFNTGTIVNSLSNAASSTSRIFDINKSSFTYYIADASASAPASTGYGMKIWNSGGTLVYDSGLSVLDAYDAGAFTTGSVAATADVTHICMDNTGDPFALVALKRTSNTVVNKVSPVDGSVMTTHATRIPFILGCF